jgi:hypothetical protein
MPNTMEICCRLFSHQIVFKKSDSRREKLLLALIFGYYRYESTVIKADDETALLWVHGVATALNPRLKHYQGKRRLPAPLVLRRHAGTSELSVFAEEIFGLSKMNWTSR